MNSKYDVVMCLRFIAIETSSKEEAIGLAYSWIDQQMISPSPDETWCDRSKTVTQHLTSAENQSS